MTSTTVLWSLCLHTCVHTIPLTVLSFHVLIISMFWNWGVSYRVSLTSWPLFLLLFDHAITVGHHLALTYALVFHTILNYFSRTLNVLTSTAALILLQQPQVWGRMPLIKIIKSEQFIKKIIGKHEKETHSVACVSWLVPWQLSYMEASPSASKPTVTDTWDLMRNPILTSLKKNRKQSLSHKKESFPFMLLSYKQRL